MADALASAEKKAQSQLASENILTGPDPKRASLSALGIKSVLLNGATIVYGSGKHERSGEFIADEKNGIVMVMHGAGLFSKVFKFKSKKIVPIKIEDITKILQSDGTILWEKPQAKQQIATEQRPKTEIKTETLSEEESMGEFNLKVLGATNLMKKGDYKKAIAAYTELIRIYPDEKSALHNNLATCYFKTNQLAKSADELDLAFDTAALGGSEKLEMVKKNANYLTSQIKPAAEKLLASADKEKDKKKQGELYSRALEIFEAEIRLMEHHSKSENGRKKLDPSFYMWAAKCCAKLGDAKKAKFYTDKANSAKKSAPAKKKSTKSQNTSVTIERTKGGSEGKVYRKVYVP